MNISVCARFSFGASDGDWLPHGSLSVTASGHIITHIQLLLLTTEPDQSCGTTQSTHEQHINK